MSPYHSTIEEDLLRADEILMAGHGNGEGSTIYRQDIHDAYHLLKSFVAHIGIQRGELEANRRYIEYLEKAARVAKDLTRTAQEQITEATLAHDAYIAASLPPQRMGPLSADHPAVNKPCPGCRRLILAGAFVTLLTIGPGEDPEERMKARDGRPYNAVAVVAHWECVTGQTEP
jgi:hypothetical protein